MASLNEEEISLVIDALRNSLQDTLDYAAPDDYEEGELESHFSARVKLLEKLGGSTVGLSGKNNFLLEEAS